MRSQIFKVLESNSPCHLFLQLLITAMGKENNKKTVNNIKIAERTMEVLLQNKGFKSLNYIFKSGLIENLNSYPYVG
jgi:hypothetical protein